MTGETTVHPGPTKKGDDSWQDAKRDLKYLPQRVEGILGYAKEMIDNGGRRDHPTRVYVVKPSDRFLALMTPALGLKPIEWGSSSVRWQVALSEETDKIDPVAARNVNNFIAKQLQEFFWKKDACFVVDSARSAPESNLISVDFSRQRTS